MKEFDTIVEDKSLSFNNPSLSKGTDKFVLTDFKKGQGNIIMDEW